MSLMMRSAPKNITRDQTIPHEKRRKNAFLIRFLTRSPSCFSIAVVSTGRSELRNIVPYIIPTSTIFIGRE